MPVPKSLDRVFGLIWSFVIFVSVVDGYLVFHYRDVIGSLERNPAGLFLLAINGGRVWLFLFLKFLGTIVSCMLLLVLYRNNAYLGLAIAVALALFQLGLLIFLGWA